MSELHALFIGIDDYLPDRSSGGGHYPSLEGPVRDVRCMAALLAEREGLTREKTRFLTSQANGQGSFVEPPEQRATYANIVAAFTQLAAEVGPDDRVYIHYSGHGAQTPTEYPELKRSSGWDESLVPCDIGDPSARPLTDIELALLLRLVVERSRLVTVVLDCCHAGGALRGHGRVRQRNLRGLPRARVESALAPRASLIEMWRRLETGAGSLAGLARSAGRGCVLFAACRSAERAYELPCDGEQMQGALTYWLHDTLRHQQGLRSCGQIHNRLLSRIHARLPYQTPVLFGDGSRAFLDGEQIRAAEQGTLLFISEGQLLLNTGTSQGVSKGSRFILPSGAVLEVGKAGSSLSVVELVEGRLEGTEPGAQAAPLPLQCTVRLVPPEVEGRVAEDALKKLHKALLAYRGGFIEPCGTGEADFEVTVDAQGFYEIRDAAGDTFPSLRPLRADVFGTADAVVRRLDHLTRFRNVRVLENPKPEAPSIQIELIGKEAETRPIELRVGEKISVRIANRSRLTLDFAVLDLRPDYGISQILPTRSDFSALTLEPDGERTININHIWLPNGLDEGTDILKVFATLNHLSFRWLELPALDLRQPVRTLRGHHEPKNPLEQLFAMLAARAPRKRSLTPSEFPDEEWATTQMEIRVRR